MGNFNWTYLLLVGLSVATLIASSKNNASSSTSYYQQANESTDAQSMRHYAIHNGSSMIADAPLDIMTMDLEEDMADDDHLSHADMLAKMADRSSSVEEYERHLERSSIIYGLARVANGSNVNGECYTHLKHVQRAILRKESWAMKVLDSSGTKPAGFVFGQNFWLGSREACGAVQRPVGITLSKNFQRVMHYSIITEMAPFDMDYRVVYLRHHSPWQVEIKLMSEQVIHIGLCLPSACRSSEIQRLTTDYVERGSFVENEIYDIRPEVIYMKDLKLSESFYQKTTFKLIVSCTLFTLAMMLSASFLRVRTSEEVKDAAAEAKVKATPVDGISDVSGGHIDHTDPLDLLLHKAKDFIRCYDVGANCEKMFATRETTTREIPVINGLRSVCAMWILIFHVVWFMYFTVNNKTFLISYAERVFFQYVSSAPVLVDVFFTISGFLQTFNFLRNAKQMETIRSNSFGQNMKTFGKMLFHRYLRLGPLYLLISGLVALCYSYMSDVSVYHIHERFDQICSEHWWRNVFFIQNLFNHNDMCLNWTWSLACEMQFFILVTLLLFTYAKHPRFVKIATVAAFTATVVWTYAIGLNSKFQLSFDSAFATGTEVYISPFVRVMPYIMGAVTGWFLIERQMQIDISDMQEKCLWNLSILVFFICIYSTIKRDMSYLLSITLFVFGRVLFSGSVCWMIMGSATGRGSWWSRVLEAKIFQHFNRLTYAIYLLNPFVIAFVFSLTNASTHADPFMLCVVTSGFAVIVYIAAIIFSLAFEMPYCNWSSLMLKREKLKSS